MDHRKPNLVKNGGILKIPIGFRFLPTDEELLVHYLKRKVHSLPLPAAAIPELDVFQCNPWDLPGDSKEKRYFFGKRNRNSNRSCNQMIGTGSGHWKGIAKEKQVMASSSGSNQAAPIGVRKTLVFFYKGKKKRLRGLQTRGWIMHEFRLTGSSATTGNACQKFTTEMEEGCWAVCCIYQKKAKSKRSGARNGNIVPPKPSSSCSSEISEISSKGSDRQKG